MVYNSPLKKSEIFDWKILFSATNSLTRMFILFVSILA